MINKIIIITDATCKVPNAHIKGRTGKRYAAIAGVIIDASENILWEKGKYLGEKTVPEAEMEALIMAFDEAAGYCRKNVEIRMDSELCVKWMNGEYRLKKEHIRKLFDKVKELEKRFDSVQYIWHTRESKWAKYVDNLADKEYKKYMKSSP